MAKSKKTISEIQKALLTNTRFIKEDEPAVEITKPGKIEVKPNPQDFALDPSVVKRYKILAAYLNVPIDELMNTALNHYLKLKSVQLEHAILKLTGGE